MPLASGVRLGPYDILSPIGAGGMGEVYRARDTRLQREVAVKVLPDEFARDADRLARFEREAQAVAALNHPNILAIYDVGQAPGPAPQVPGPAGDRPPATGQPSAERQAPSADGRSSRADGSGPHAPSLTPPATIHYIVTELLDGESLRARLEHGPLPVRKAVDTAIQIAHGLAAAHDKGLVHRDLKPDNVFLLADGQVKILDFGLARPAAAHSGSAATVAAITDAGTTMGTVGYMAPEQVRGGAVDARTDLFALGAVLYEMLSGRRAFQRDTAAETMTAILREDPPELTSVRAELSPALERIVRHCLEKNAAERFQTARDVAFALEAFSGTSVTTVSGAAPAGAAGRSWARWAVLPLAVVLALAAGVALDRLTRPAAPPITFETKTWDAEWITNARFGPDGQTILFSAARTGNVPSLYVIRPHTVVTQPLGDPGTELLSVSSKGELAVLINAQQGPIGHRTFSGTLARMTMDGAPRPWLTGVTEADWSPDGSTLAVTRLDPAASVLEYPIGHVLYRNTGGYISDIRVSPDGQDVAFFDHQTFGDDRGWLKVVDANGAVRTLAGEYWGEEGLAWASDGRRVVFAASGEGGEALQPLTVNATGTPIVRQALPSAGALLVLDVSATGRVLVSRDSLRYSIRALIPGDHDEREFPWLDYATMPFLSPDGASLVFNDESQSAGADYAVALRSVTSDKVVNLGPGSNGDFSPDGKWVVAILPSSGDVVFYPTGPGETQKLARGPIEHYFTGGFWLPGGHTVLFCGNEHGKPPRCYTQAMTAAAPTPVTPEGVTFAMPAPDGRTLLASTSTNTYELLTLGGSAAPAPAKGLMPTDSPLAWTADGRGVFVQVEPGLPAQIVRVDLTTGARTLVKELMPPDRAGVTSLGVFQWIDGGRGYTYKYSRDLSQLFAASGVLR